MLAPKCHLSQFSHFARLTVVTNTHSQTMLHIDICSKGLRLALVLAMRVKSVKPRVKANGQY